MKATTLAFYGCALGLLGLGLREWLLGYEENRCSMTYMFEYPEYRVSEKMNACLYCISFIFYLPVHFGQWALLAPSTFEFWFYVVC